MIVRRNASFMRVSSASMSLPNLFDLISDEIRCTVSADAPVHDAADRCRVEERHGGPDSTEKGVSVKTLGRLRADKSCDNTERECEDCDTDPKPAIDRELQRQISSHSAASSRIRRLT